MDDDAPCTDCGGTGITYQTERRCSCEAGESIGGEAVSGLKPCPFCGAEAQPRYDYFSGSSMKHHFIVCTKDTNHRGGVGCYNAAPGRSNPSASVGSCDKCQQEQTPCHFAAAAWNQRTEPDATQTYIAWQQSRGIAADAVDWAANEYREFMKDDRFDAWDMLHKLGQRMCEISDLHRPQAVLEGKTDAS